MINSLKRIYRYLINNNRFFLRLHLQRFSSRYPSKILHEADNKSTVHFIHRYITNNTGDIACGYYRYFLDHFKAYQCVVHDVNCVDLSKIKDIDSVIIGGGGLLNATEEWNYNIIEAAKLARRSIIWSAGFNSYAGKKFHNAIDWNLFDLVAVRDFKYGDFRFVPCATCFMPELSINYEIKREVGVIGHKDVLHHLPTEFRQYELLTNSASLSEFVAFIGSSQIVLTNSYHAIYWATLLGKKAILFAPRSEKYNFYKYSPHLYTGDLEADLMAAKVYPEAMSDCRSLTMEYLKDIKSTIKS
ncbi:polysaccharide pyruvyl transferase family protein [Sphingobacterium sp. lm-10]|uniref:polysaccharide pyruvyl transferase family protein n=1 Tax=Sphingobacterium sp. lm-10 TaxID=2944904 RepID=UPI0020200528|nr:polysaccharide pyruvyl transferase family protein [Sphingobacterium sp. lm-10]MCL7988648.1 polysaccharide pyruvyl transferase family protein [Sphingobacterium sp. lm-10]